MKKKFTTFYLLTVFGAVFGQWTPTVMQGEKKKETAENTRYYSLDLNLIRNQLANAENSGKGAHPVIVSIPTLDGKIEKFKVYSLPVVAESLAKRYSLGSYTGVGVDNPTSYIRFSVAPNDFQSMLFRDGRYEFIEPLNNEKTVYGVFPKSKKVAEGNAFECRTTESLLSKQQIEALAQATPFVNSVTDYSKTTDQKYRTYRLAISVTGEYTSYFGGVEGALTAINATMTRVNGIFEKDFAIHMNVQDFPQLIYTNSNTDPYSNASTGAAGAWNLELQQTLTSVIGNDAYDIGHLFGRSGGGGSAGDIGNVCRNPTNNNDDTSKGSGFTSPGIGGPEGDNFDIDYVAHEMGHQFGADHTFAFGIQSSPYNTAHMEPGSGSTIMGYAGITNYDVQAHSDAYFHIRSIEQVQSYVNSKNCEISTDITNLPPVIETLADRTIPKGTAFVLTASATDAEGDPVTYAWEEYDNASSSVTSVTGNNTSGPKFRSLMPTDNPTRYFPKLSSVLNGVLSSASDWEAVSNVARTMKFKVTVRDNNPDVTQQQTQASLVTLTVGSKGPFKVITDKVYNNIPSAVVWDVVDTNTAPYNVANVKIDYTTDNGETWNTLVESTPNDGTEDLDFSSLSANSETIVRVSAIDNYFYAVKKVNVSSVVPCDGSAPVGLTVSGVSMEEANVAWDPISEATYVLKYKKASDSEWNEILSEGYSYTLTGLEEGTSYEVQVAAVCSGATGTFSQSVMFDTLSTAYCPMSASNSTEEYISNVTVTPSGEASITNNSGAGNYTDYSSDPEKLITLVRGSQGNKISVSKTWTGSQYNEAVVVWIDFNRDGNFTNDEKIMNSSASKTTPVTATFSVPADAYSGEKSVGMRVVLKFGSAPQDACTSFTYGEVEDYSVKFTDSSLGTSDMSKSTIVKVYPNPASDVLNISNIVSGTTYQIHNMAGITVMQGKINDGKVVVSKLPAGIYLISVKYGDSTTTVKFIKR